MKYECRNYYIIRDFYLIQSCRLFFLPFLLFFHTFFINFFNLNIDTWFTLFVVHYICSFENGNRLYRLKNRSRNYYFRCHLFFNIIIPIFVFSFSYIFACFFHHFFNLNIATWFILFVVFYMFLWKWKYTGWKMDVTTTISDEICCPFYVFIWKWKDIIHLINECWHYNFRWHFCLMQSCTFFSFNFLIFSGFSFSDDLIKV